MKHILLILALTSILGCSEDSASPTPPSPDVPSDVLGAISTDTEATDVVSEEDTVPVDVAPPDDVVTADPFAGAETFIIDQINQANIPGLAAAVTHMGRVIWTGAYGYANVEDKIAATVKTPFMLASVSKTVTGVAIMHAVEQGFVYLTIR